MPVAVVARCHAIPLGAACSSKDNDSCVPGAVCKKNTCTCKDKDVSTESGLLCLPKAGKVGGECDQVTACKDANAKCVDGICECEGNIKVRKEDYACCEYYYFPVQFHF
ncbi:hypothetical protein ACOMHN_007660 [Nucella lapillus]